MQRLVRLRHRAVAHARHETLHAKLRFHRLGSTPQSLTKASKGQQGAAAMVEGPTVLLVASSAESNITVW